MRTLAIAGLASVFAFTPSGAGAAVESTAGADVSYFAQQSVTADPFDLDLTAQGAKRSMRKMGGHRMGNMRRQGMQRMGHNRMQRRMHRGNQFRNGRNVRMGRMGHRRGYRNPVRGFRLPRNYINPSYFIGNFGYYGLSQPARGYGWSRYYNDAVLTDRSGVVHDSVRDLDWDRYNQGYNDGYRDGRATYDSSVLLEDDRVVATPSGAIGSSATTYRGDWDGAYREDGSYQGQWRGTYQDAEGRVYEGNYEGTFIGEGDANQVGASYADAPHWGSQQPAARDYGHADQEYDVRNDELAYLQRCKKSSGIGGAVVGGAIGALAGNRIAGRGNRLGGSLIGGGLGAVAGAAIDQGSDRCRKLQKKYRNHGHHAQRPHVQRPYVQSTYPSGWHGGYYYPAYYHQAQPTVTTIVIESQPVTTTTTTTTYIDEEVIYTRAKPAAKRRWKKAAPRKTWKAKPVLKGCQQERCLYND